MNGINKIAERILSDARQEAASMKAEAEQKAAEARRAADQEANALRQSLRDQGDEAAQRRYDLLLAAAETEAKKKTLAKKQALLTLAFERAAEHLRTMDEPKYIDLLARLAVKASNTGREQIVLNAQDREKLGNRVVAEANKRGGGSLTLAENSRPILGGLILSQGNIEVNCALDTLAALRKNELTGQTAKLLFE